MPNLDVSDLLDDADFADTIMVTGRAETVGQDGRAVVSETSFKATATVQPAGSQALRLFPEGARVEGAIRVFSRVILAAQTSTTAADVIVWKRRRYQVRAVEDFSHMGQGFSVATCELLGFTAPR